MNPSSLRNRLAPRAIRGFGLITLALLFLLSVFQLTHLPAMATNHELIDLWRGLSAVSLFLFLCFPNAERPRQRH